MPCRQTVRRPLLAFTLVEILVSIAIVAVLMSLSTVAYNRLSDSSALAQARNAVLTYAQVARSYAMAGSIETTLLVNPINGRFEIWYLNGLPQGGTWDALASDDAVMFAPVLDASARLPLDGDGRPAALVTPIDYEQRPFPQDDPSGRYMDNLVWAAVCFDKNGDLVIRTRRFPTGSNRLPNGAPDLTAQPLVDVNDVPIASTRGLVISDYSKLETVLSVATVTPAELVEDWLNHTRPGGRFHDHASTVVLNRFSGEQLGENP